MFCARSITLPLPPTSATEINRSKEPFDVRSFEEFDK
jgi:hypothetical protein